MRPKNRYFACVYVHVDMFTLLTIIYTVSGDANFTRKYTSLTVGGFMQPSVARTLIEQANREKGFTQCYLWCCRELQKVDMEFSASLGELFSTYIQEV